MGTWKGLLAMNPRTGGWRLYKHDVGKKWSISGNKIVFIKEDQRGDLWIGTYENGLNELDERRESFRHFGHSATDSTSLGSDRLVAADFDDFGDLWIGTAEHGLDVFHVPSGLADHVRHDPLNPGSIGSDRVLSVFRDWAGGMWVGTADAGVCRVDPRPSGFRLYRGGVKHHGTLSNNNVRAIAEDRSGDLWVGTAGGGLNRYARSRNEFLQYRHVGADPTSLASDYVYSVLAGSDGNIWVGTQNDGLDCYDRRNQRFRHYLSVLREPNPSGGDAVMTLYEDRHGVLWVGSTGLGLSKYDKTHDRFERVLRDGLSVLAIQEDREGQLWLGTLGGGLLRTDRDGRVLARYRHDAALPGSLSNNTVCSIYEDSATNLWVGTCGGGLNRYNRGTDDFTHFTTVDGLPNDVVYGILPDSRGNLWLSTTDGLSRFDPVTKFIKNYYESDGLQNDEFNQGAFLRGRDGTLYFGGVDGFSAIQADSIQPNVNIPPVVLTSFKIFDRPVLLSDRNGSLGPISLTFQEDFISFEFAALDYSAPERNRYAYMLEGFDRNWVLSGTRRYVAYTHLDGGHYVFKVKGSNSDGVWNESGLAIPLIITPPFWRTPAFLALILAVLTLVSFAFYRYRVRKLVEIERLRTRIASDLHDELASNLSSIALFTTIVHDAAAVRGDSTPEQEQLLRRIVALARESVTSIREIIWAIDSRPETVCDLLVRLKDTMLPVCRAKEIQLQFDDPDPTLFPQHNLPPEERKDLWLLLKEAVTNAMKHSCCSNLSIECAFERGRLKVSIEDNGKGLVPETAGNGKGFETMRMRAENLGGAIEFIGTEGGGTTVHIDVHL
jgi:ligand-binding sensor domain-containing protein